jgi:phage portal protein BeeE
LSIFSSLVTKLGVSRAPQRNPNADPVKNMRGFWVNGVDGMAPVNYEQIFKVSHALRHPAIFRCVDKIAACVQEAPLIARKIPKEEGITFTRQDATVKAIQAVLDNPNDDFNRIQFKYWLALNMALFGQLFVKVGRNSSLLPNAIYPLQTQNTTILLTQNGRIRGYRILTVDGLLHSDIPTRKVVEGEELNKVSSGAAWGHHIFRPSEDVLKMQNSPLAAATLPADIIGLLFARARDTASGAPNVRYLVTTDGTTTKEQEDSVIEMFKQSVPDGEKSGQVGFISGSAVKIIELNNTLMDIHSKIPMDDMFRIVGAIYGVPMALLGISSADGSKFAQNFVESRLAFVQDTVIPSYLHPIECGLTEALCPPGYEIVFDRDNIQALNDERVNKALKLKDIPFLTDAEKRVACDYPAVPIHGTLPPTPSNFSKPTADGLPPAEGVNGGGTS